VITVLESNDEVYKAQIREAFINLDYLDSSLSYITILTGAKLLEMEQRHRSRRGPAKDSRPPGRTDSGVARLAALFTRQQTLPRLA
jgi:DNA helicase-2/ATP-dependent DNA helicase PcrA